MANRSSVARSRARSRSPAAAAATAAARSAGDALGGEAVDDDLERHRPEVDADRAGRDRDELRRDVLGEDHEERRGGRLLDVLEEDRPELVDEVEVLEDEDLAGALRRAERRLLHDLPGRGGVDAPLGGGRLDDVEVGVGLGQGQPGVALGDLARRCPRRAGAPRTPGGGPLAGAGRPDEEVGVHRVGGGRRELGDGVVLADHVGPHVDAEGHAHRRIIAPPPSQTRSGNRMATIVPDGRGHGVRGLRAVDHGEALGVGDGLLEEAVVDPPVEVPAGRLEPVAGATGPLERDRQRHLEQDDEVGPQVLGGPPREVGDLHRVELAAVALVRHRRRDVAVGDDRAAGGEGGTDHLGHVLRPVGGHEERLGPRGDLEGGPVEQQLAHRGPERGVAGLEGAQRAEALGEDARPGWTCRCPRRPRRR